MFGNVGRSELGCEEEVQKNVSRGVRKCVGLLVASSSI